MRKEALLLAVGMLFLVSLSASIAQEDSADTRYAYVVYDNTTHDLDVNVSDHAAVDNSFFFGVVTSPGSSERTVIVPKTFGEEVMAEVTFSGEMASWITTKSFVPLLQPYSRLRITLILNVPPNVSLGLHYADMRVVYTKVDAPAEESSPESSGGSEACAGCVSGGLCLPYESRLKTDDGRDVFCGRSGQIEGQKPAGSACQGSYECLNNDCVNGKCADIAQKPSLFQMLIKWIMGLFSGK